MKTAHVGAQSSVSMKESGLKKESSNVLDKQNTSPNSMQLNLIDTGSKEILSSMHRSTFP